MNIILSLQSTLKNLEALREDEKNPFKWQLMSLDIDSLKEVIRELNKVEILSKLSA